MLRLILQVQKNQDLLDVDKGPHLKTEPQTKLYEHKNVSTLKTYKSFRKKSSRRQKLLAKTAKTISYQRLFFSLQFFFRKTLYFIKDCVDTRI